MSQLLTIAGVLVVSVAAFAGLVVVGWRAKSPLVLHPVVALSKRTFNPRNLRTAGTPGAYAGIIRHRGRTSGTSYATPVAIVAHEDGFLIALPYGDRTQWLRNVQAAGTAELVHEGATYVVDHPELITTASVAHAFPPSDQKAFRVLNVDRCLRLHQVAVATPVPAVHAA